MIKITLSRYKSPYFPIKASFQINGIEYYSVHETIQNAKSYYTGYFNRVTFTEEF